VLTNLEKVRKELKAESLEKGRAIDSEAKSIVAKIEAFQLPHKDAYKELDGLRKQREIDRKENLANRVADIRDLPEAMADSDSEGVKMALESLQVEECLDFYEFTAEALKARNASREALGKMFADKLKYEKEQVELAELRKKQAEQERKDRDERIAREATAKAEAKTKEAEVEKQRAIDAAALAVEQREASELKAKHDAGIAAAKAQVDADEAAAKAEQDLLDRQKVEREAEAEKQREIEANTKHVGKIRGEAKDDLMAVCKLDAKAVVLAIKSGSIRNVVINY
jgi:hypothetical protein